MQVDDHRRQHQHDGVVEEERGDDARRQHEAHGERERPARAPRRPQRQATEEPRLGQRLVEQQQPDQEHDHLDVDQVRGRLEVHDAQRQEGRSADEGEAGAVERYAREAPEGHADERDAGAGESDPGVVVQRRRHLAARTMRRQAMRRRV